MIGPRSDAGRLYAAAAALMIAGFVLLAWGFSRGPIFEGPDEIEHFRYVQTIARTGQLPPPDGQRGGQYHQPPLYYLLSAPLLAWLDDTGFTQIDGRKNPFYPHEISIPGNDNKNLYLHSRATETSPVAQAVYTLRLLPLLFGTLTLIVCARLFALIFEQNAVRLAALAAAAFHPQFAYLSAVINNDSLLILLATLTLYLLVRAQRTGLTARRALLLGLVCGALLITKTSGLFAGLTVALAFALHRRWWRWLPLTALAVLLVAGGWYGRNLLVYHDPFLTAAWQRTWPDDVIADRAAAVQTALARLPFAYETFWARFGGGAVGVSPALRAIWDGLVLLAVLGWGVQGWRGRGQWDWRLALLLTLFGLSWIGATFYLATLAWSGIQGRYLLPGLAVWALLIGGGLMQLIPRQGRALAAGGFSAGLGVLAFGVLLGYFLPAYQPAPPQTTGLTTHDYTYADTAALIGSRLSTTRAAPGDVLTVTLTWRALRTPAEPLRVYLHALDPAGSPAQHFIGRDSYPGTGNFLSEDWQTGDLWSEHYLVRVAADTPAQTVYTLIAGLYDAQTNEPLIVTGTDGAALLPVIGRVGVPGAVTALSEPVYRFGDSIGLGTSSLDVNDMVYTLCLDWRALQDGAADYTVFVHLLDAAGQLVGQADAPPLSGQYPTSFWRQGERIADCVTLEADRAADRVAFGLYDPISGERLPVHAAGTRLPDSQVILIP
jgi:4-amino-4-deoxy-L-arabinose transferase-like glycosyltransferase